MFTVAVFFCLRIGRRAATWLPLAPACREARRPPIAAEPVGSTAALHVNAGMLPADVWLLVAGVVDARVAQGPSERCDQGIHFHRRRCGETVSRSELGPVPGADSVGDAEDTSSEFCKDVAVSRKKEVDRCW